MGVKTYVSLLAALVGLPLAVDATEPERSTRSDECVVLLHGLARTAGAMKPVEKALAKVGYTVHNIGYASRKDTIETLAEDAVSRGVSECSAQDASTIHFVTHSMGGILVRYYLAKHSIPKLGHVVMMAPPNQGSEVVDDWSDRPGFALLNGPAGMQLGTDDDSIPSK
ncbi:MAG: alpha/beta hydrolase, partial [Pseudomonadota bacterium]